ncbi:sulfotransferase [Caulobacter segnis]
MTKEGEGGSEEGAGRSARRARAACRRPLFIVAAPRSGSTLLFETLARSQALCTVGGEAIRLVEGLAELRPGAGGVESNRLTEADATDAYRQHMIDQIMERLVDHEGSGAWPGTGPLVFLEKDAEERPSHFPSSASLFPEARFIFSLA